MLAGLVFATTAWPLTQLGGEFMPADGRGRPALHALGTARAFRRPRPSQLLQQTDRLIQTVPEVDSVFGKAGRADTATDPAPLEMFETTIQFKPRDQWRAGMTPEQAGRGAGPRA